MADNLPVPGVSGANIATRDIGSAGSPLHLGRQTIEDAAGVDAIGLVGASPAANTLLGRLKALYDALVERLPTLGAKAATGSLSVVPSTGGFDITSTQLLAKLTEIQLATAETLARAKATYALGLNVQLAANAGGTPIANVYAGSYIWTAVTSAASVALQVLGADGTTWQTVETIAAGGGPKGVVLPEGSSIRLYNPTSGAATVSGKLG